MIYQYRDQVTLKVFMTVVAGIKNRVVYFDFSQKTNGHKNYILKIICSMKSLSPPCH